MKGCPASQWPVKVLFRGEVGSSGGAEDRVWGTPSPHLRPGQTDVAMVPAMESLLLETRGPLGVVTLNRPKALNALNLEMIQALSPKLDAWARDEAIRAVVIRGAGPKAFCAGGDVRAVAASVGTESGEAAYSRQFFLGEYALNHRIHHFPKPFIALVDGICMGGGLGLSAHGSHRVVTEKLLLAMPETAIGLFPDVGGGWFLPRMPGEAGTYLGLTGRRCTAADAKWLGYASCVARSDALEDLVEALVSADWGSAEAGTVASKLLEGFAVDPGPSALESQRDTINRIFGAGSMRDIVSALQREENAWSEETLSTLARHCPFSLKVTLRQLRLGRTLEYDEVAKLEYRLSQAMTSRPDFSEGIRAVLIDKDNAPRWIPSSLEEVSDEEVERCFAPRGADELRF